MLSVNNDCCRCDVCVKVCPVPGTITKILPGPVQINPHSCIECNRCVPACPFDCITATTPAPAAPIDAQPEAPTGTGILTVSSDGKSKPKRKG